MMRALSLLLPLALLPMVMLGCGQERLAEGPAPEFQLRDLKTEETLGKKSLLGHPVVIDFWETWCEPCRQTMPEVQKLQDDYAKSGVRVVGISDESREKVAEFVRDRSLSYQFALDPDGKAAEKFGLDGYPTLLILDKEGKIVYRASPPDYGDVRNILDRLVKS